MTGAHALAAAAALSLLVACGTEPIRQRSRLGIAYRQTWFAGQYRVQAGQFTGELEATRPVQYSLRYAKGSVSQSGIPGSLPAGECLRGTLPEGGALAFTADTDVSFIVPPAGCGQ